MFKEIYTLRPFFEAPNTEFNVREIARILKITPATASKRLKDLKSTGFIKYRKERILDLYKADLGSEIYRNLKTYYTIQQLNDTGLLEALNRFYLKPAIVLFGSASKGMDTKDSDIDLLIITENIKVLPDQKKYEQKLKRKIQLFTHKSIKEIRNEHLVNNMANGITLQGNVEWIWQNAKEKDISKRQDPTRSLQNP
ncbi:MAG: nucleotidyltransferase domain-containing protein [Candidatus Aenigmarchaeota archaeon]|nr:nucleotidyltransferase domain-containing protein [Candidatus Aenigmarchaeota archaeon]